MRLVGVSLFGDHAGAPLVDIAIDNGLIAAITPSTAARSPRRLAMPALANAHDHARPLSPTSFGGAGKPLETWLLRLAALPAINAGATSSTPADTLPHQRPQCAVGSGAPPVRSVNRNPTRANAGARVIPAVAAMTKSGTSLARRKP